MFIIGLTGPTGAGKTTVSRVLSKHGYYVADGDDCARRVTAKGSPVLKELAKAFGDNIIHSSGMLNRLKLASIAFSTPSNTKILNSIMHPLITERIFSDISNAESNGFDTAVIDAAVLIESGIINRCAMTVVVTAPPKIRLSRILKRDAITREEALMRMEAQNIEEYYERFADIIIRNYYPYQLEDELHKLYYAVERKRHETTQQK